MSYIHPMCGVLNEQAWGSFGSWLKFSSFYWWTRLDTSHWAMQEGDTNPGVSALDELVKISPVNLSYFDDLQNQIRSLESENH